MADVKLTYTFELDPAEIAILLKLVGRESTASIDEFGLDVLAFERLWEVLTRAAYVPMRDSAP